MSETIFRKVLCSDRLPELEGPYDTNCGRLHFVPKIDIFETSIVEWWYEPIELPSEEEIPKIVIGWLNKQQFKSNYIAEPHSFEAGFKHAIELIKGGK